MRDAALLKPVVAGPGEAEGEYVFEYHHAGECFDGDFAFSMLVSYVLGGER
jgi:hypothetical protein